MLLHLLILIEFSIDHSTQLVARSALSFALTLNKFWEIRKATNFLKISNWGYTNEIIRNNKIIINQSIINKTLVEGFKKTWKCKLWLHFFAGLNKANKSLRWRRSSLCFATSTLPKSEKELSSSHIEWLKRWWRRRRGVLKVMRHAKELQDKGWLTNYTLQRAGVEERGTMKGPLGPCVHCHCQCQCQSQCRCLCPWPCPVPGTFKAPKWPTFCAPIKLSTL